MSARILVGHVVEQLATLDDASVQMCCTSPPYWGLRDYGVAGQIGLELTIEGYVQTMVQVFREVRRVLRNDGTLWLNLGDSYASVGKWGGSTGGKHVAALHGNGSVGREKRDYSSLKPKDRCMIPARVAIALQADGWWLRDEIVWHKPNPMPSSVTDRTTPAHEMIYLLARSARYAYYADAIRTPFAETSIERLTQPNIENQIGSARANGGAKTNGNMKAVGRIEVPDSYKGSVPGRNGGPGQDRRSRNARGNRLRADLNANWESAENAGALPGGANRRSVWSIATTPYPDAHFATFPEELPRLCILAGTKEGDVVLDPFAGSGTTLAVAEKLGRDSIGIELNPEYAKLIERRLASITPAMRFAV